MFNYEINEPAIWTVSGLTSYLRDLFEVDYRLQEITIVGEITNFSRARSGHLYFILKDEDAQLRCVMWRSNADHLGFQPNDGDAVEASGRVSIYEAGGVYQLYVDRIDPAGRGDLAQAFERLKMKLADEGLFDEEHKIPIPYMPNKIGIVTSADAAALQDILNVLARRWPVASVLIAQSLVQGNEAPQQLIRSIKWLDDRQDIDTMIVARGGGSIEDLSAFNDEKVARAIFATRHPVIVGVGHETDFTIADFVADRRAPTPSVAAELAVPDIVDIKNMLYSLQLSQVERMTQIISLYTTQLKIFEKGLAHLSPYSIVINNLQRVDWLSSRLDQAISTNLREKSNRFELALRALEGVNPFATLARGYAIVQGYDGNVIHSVDDVSKGDRLKIRVSDGELGAIAE